MRAYAPRFGGDVELWGMTGLLHDLDYEKYPNLESGHPRMAIAELERLGFPPELVRAVASHADFMGVPRETAMEKALYAVDELSGFILAVAYVRPEGLTGMTPKSVKKKLKQPSFAAAVGREDLRSGAEELGVDFDEHLATVIAALEVQQSELLVAASASPRPRMAVPRPLPYVDPHARRGLFYRLSFAGWARARRAARPARSCGGSTVADAPHRRALRVRADPPHRTAPDAGRAQRSPAPQRGHLLPPRGAGDDRHLSSSDSPSTPPGFTTSAPTPTWCSVVSASSPRSSATRASARGSGDSPTASFRPTPLTASAPPGPGARSQSSSPPRRRQGRRGSPPVSWPGMLRIVVLEGDETGQELLDAALPVLGRDVCGLEIELVHYDLSLVARRASANGVVHEAAQAMREAGFGIKAATITPEGADDVGSPNRILREEIDGKVIIRTGRRIPGVSPIAGVHFPDRRRAHGGRRRLRGQAVARGQPATDEIAYRTERISRSTCHAVAEYAFRTAAAISGRVYGGPKWTVSPVYEGMFKEELDAAAARHPDVAYAPVLIDATYAGLISGAADSPLVIPALNRDGDCLSDLVLPMFGSIAGAESVLLAFDDDYETRSRWPRRRTAPLRHCSANLANPLAMMLACGAILHHAGAAGHVPARARASRAIYEAALEGIAAGVRTPDLGGQRHHRLHRATLARVARSSRCGRRCGRDGGRMPGRPR